MSTAADPESVLHDWFVEERELQRHADRRGRRHAFEHLDPRRTALVVIDLVPFFFEASPYCRGIVPQVNALAGELRAAGGTVAWVVPGYSTLPDLLEERGVDTVVMTGTVTNVCVEASVRDAATLGLRVILVADACAAMRDQDHNATLHVVHRTYGDVRSTDEVLGLIRAGRTR